MIVVTQSSELACRFFSHKSQLLLLAEFRSGGPRGSGIINPGAARARHPWSSPCARAHSFRRHAAERALHHDPVGRHRYARAFPPGNALLLFFFPVPHARKSSRCHSTAVSETRKRKIGKKNAQRRRDASAYRPAPSPSPSFPNTCTRFPRHARHERDPRSSQRAESPSLTSGYKRKRLREKNDANRTAPHAKNDAVHSVRFAFPNASQVGSGRRVRPSRRRV